MPVLEYSWVQAKLTSFHAMANTFFSHCSSCNGSFPSMKLTCSCSAACNHFSRDKQEPKLYSAANNMEPDPVPPALQGLTQVEEMLISPVMPILSVYRLPHGQFGYSGHVINLPQDVAKSLPCMPSQLVVYT